MKEELPIPKSKEAIIAIARAALQRARDLRKFRRTQSMDTILLTDESGKSELVEVENLKQHFEALGEDRAFIKVETKRPPSKDCFKALANQSALAELWDNPEEDSAWAYLAEEEELSDEVVTKVQGDPTTPEFRTAWLSDLKKPVVAAEYLMAVMELKLPIVTAQALKNIAEANNINFYSSSGEL